MIARNYIRFPDALLAQRELELVYAVRDDVSEADMVCIRATFAASGAWLRQYAGAAVRVVHQMPAWFDAMRRRARALAQAVKKALFKLF